MHNGAKHHVAMREDLFQDSKYYGEAYTVITADGNMTKNVRKDTVHVEANVKNKIENLERCLVSSSD